MTYEHRLSRKPRKIVRFFFLITRTSMTKPVGWIGPSIFLLVAVFAQAADVSWSGIVRNASGDPIAAATVRLMNDQIALTATTDITGRFHFGNLKPGGYRLSIAPPGQRASEPYMVQISAKAAPAEIILSERNTLSASDPKASGASGGEDLSSQAVSELPLNKRDFSQLLLLAAGTMTDSNGTANFTQQFAVNGQRGTAAVFAMDGADVSDPEMGGATFSNFNVDAVQEIRSSSGWMPAEIGRGAAGYTNIITRTGTNDLHGSAFEFLRNSALDARNFFDRRSLAQPD